MLVMRSMKPMRIGKGGGMQLLGKKNYDVIQVAYISDGDTGKRRREKFSEDYTRERNKKVEGAT